jgi:hypothetical protein
VTTFSRVVRSSGASLASGRVAAEGKADFFGTVLTAEQARTGPRLDQLWVIVDFVITEEPTIAGVTERRP